VYLHLTAARARDGRFHVGKFNCQTWSCRFFFGRRSVIVVEGGAILVVGASLVPA